MENLQFLSIGLEVIIAVLLFLVARRPGQSHFYGLTLSFAIYVFYDLARALSWPISESLVTLVFLVATLGALYTAWKLYRR